MEGTHKLLCLYYGNLLEAEGDKMKTFTVKKKLSASTTLKLHPYVHHPMGLAQQAQRAEIRRILHATGAQAKPTTGQSNDKYEHEADRVADKAVRMRNVDVAQRQPENDEEDETLQTKPHANQIIPIMRRQEEPPEEEEELQAKSKAGVIPAVTPSLESRINSLKGGGQPLDSSTRAFFEPRFGHDFSHVRIHQGGQATDVSQSINARAFTLGNNVVFASGQYQPQSSQGKQLLGHELAHVVQQNGSAAPFPAGENSALVSTAIQRKVNYISQVTGKEAKPFFLKFDKSVSKIASLIKGQTGPVVADLHQALAILKALRAKGKITLWNTSGGLQYASYHSGTGEIRLHVVHGAKATASGTLVHEAIHALHAVRFPRLAKMYAKVLAAGGTTNRNQVILLHKFKAWTEYWAYRKAAVYENLRQEPEFFTDPHKSAMSEKGVTGSINRVTKETGKPFEPWRWDPPAKYKTVKK